MLCTWRLLGLRKCYSHLVGDSFLAGKAAWVVNGYLLTENADYCMLVNEWQWLRSWLEVHLSLALESGNKKKMVC